VAADRAGCVPVAGQALGIGAPVVGSAAEQARGEAGEEVLQDPVPGHEHDVRQVSLGGDAAAGGGEGGGAALHHDHLPGVRGEGRRRPQAGDAAADHDGSFHGVHLVLLTSARVS
jgi:hypothetical protein